MLNTSDTYHGRYLIILLFTLSAFIPVPKIFAQNYNIDFERISIEEGLSQSSIQAIIQDDRGFLWFATQDGLNKYDGYTFKIFQHNADDSLTLSDDWISALSMDNQGNLWIGTAGGGLNYYNKLTGKFTRFMHDESNPYSISDDRILSLYCDVDGTLWIGTDGGGLNKYNHLENSFTVVNLNDQNGQPLHAHISYIYRDSNDQLWLGTNGKGLARISSDNKLYSYTHAPEDKRSISSNQVLKIFEDRANILWIGTDRGLNRLQDNGRHFIHYIPDPDDPYTISDGVIYDIFEDQNQTLWIATDGGLNFFNPRTGRFWSRRNESSNSSSLSNDLVRCIYAERSGTVWVGTYGGGLNQYNWRKRLFGHYRQIAGDPNSLHDNTVWSITQDAQKRLWIGTNKGAARLDRTTHQIEIFETNFRDESSISDNIIRVVYRDKQGTIWLGTNNGGLNRFVPKRNKFDRFMHNPGDDHSISSNTVRAIYEDHEGNLWIGTWAGLEKFDRKKGRFIHYKNDLQDPNTISDDRVRCLVEDHNGILWVGTYGGLNKFDRESGSFVHYMSNPDNPNSLSHDRVLNLYCDRDGILWIGTYGGGLNRFDPKTNNFTHFTEKDGLANNAIYGILEDEQDQLWLSTNRGLSRYNKKSGTFRNYDINDGLQSNEFNGGAYYKSEKGELFFGGINGFNSFFPEKIKENNYIPPVVLTSFQVFDREVDLKNNISETDTIILSYKQNFFSFEFAALDYTNPEKNQYAYILEGFDQNWNEVGTRRFANYTNIQGGEYVFRVKGSNSDGVWNDAGVAIHIIIIPPFWNTLWFRIIAGILVIGVIYGVYHTRITKVERQKRKLQKEIRQRTQEIQDRNVELIQAKRQTDHILKNVADGLFLLKNDFSIESQYSLALEDILGEKELAGKNFLKIIENRVMPTVYTSTIEYLELMFDYTVDEATINELNPLTRIEYFHSGDGAEKNHTHFLGFRVQRIIEANRIRHLIVSVSDMTDQIKLASELEESETRTKKQLEWLVNILHIEAPLLRDFIETVQRELDEIEQTLRDVEDTDYIKALQKVSRMVVLIKSNASLLDLKYFMNSADEFAERIEEIRKKQNIQGTDFVPMILKLGEMKRNLRDIDNLIDRISQIRTFFRPKRKYENQILINSVENLVKNLAKDLEKDVELEISQFTGEDIPYNDRILVKNVLVEMVHHIIDHEIETREERIHTKKAERSLLEIQTFNEDQQYGLVIRDDGRGINTELVQATTEPEYEAEHTLYKVKRLIEESDGTIYVDAKPGKYCEFKIIWPLQKT